MKNTTILLLLLLLFSCNDNSSLQTIVLNQDTEITKLKVQYNWLYDSICEIKIKEHQNRILINELEKADEIIIKKLLKTNTKTTN